jgi:hypothetical protein
MTKRAYLLTPLVITAGLAMVAERLWAGEVSGIVRDRVPDAAGKQPPLGGVHVTLITKDNKRVPARDNTTNSEGEYVVDDAPAGEGTVEFKLVGYVNYPTEVPVDVKPNDKAKADAYLMKSEPMDDGTYLARLARDIARQGMASDEWVKIYRFQWVTFHQFNLPVSSKIVLAQEWTTADTRVTEAIPLLAQYRQLDAKKVRELEQQIEKVVLEPERVSVLLKQNPLPSLVLCDLGAQIARRGFPENLEQRATFLKAIEANIQDDTKEELIILIGLKDYKYTAAKVDFTGTTIKLPR